VPLRLYNSLTRQREDFAPRNPPRVGMYVCGPTVYGHSHLGHAKSYVSFDVILRWLRASGYQVNYVQNITDVGHLTNNDEDAGVDPIVREARARGLHPMAVVETFLRSYLEDMDALNVLRPDIMPRATGHVPEQIELARTLIQRGHGYLVNGSVYFDVSSFPDYGKLSGRRFERMEAGARVAVNPEKRHPADFALWKRAEPEHVMRWPSPWGEGFPGWHLECSAMSQKYLGDSFDIHGGGIENQFPHHECEIAQSECATGKPFVRYWLHNNMVTLAGQKMGKSLGNALILKDIFHGREGGVRNLLTGEPLLERTFEPAVVRHLILTSHYRAPIDFTNEGLFAAESGSYRLRDALREMARAAQAQETGRRPVPQDPQGGPPGVAGPPPLADRLASLAPSEPVRAALTDGSRRFADAMNEDFNTAAAIATLFDLARQTGAWIREGAPRDDLAAAHELMRHLTGDVLGLRWQDSVEGDSGARGERSALIQVLVDLRDDARKGRNFALSDQIRERLKLLGIELKDGPAGTTW
jgi:cysteinyl-tRNA synthetase